METFNIENEDRFVEYGGTGKVAAVEKLDPEAQAISSDLRTRLSI